jgi:hypothetical protein
MEFAATKAVGTSCYMPVRSGNDKQDVTRDRAPPSSHVDLAYLLT